MTEPAPSQQSELELKNEFAQIYDHAMRTKSLIEKQKKEPLTAAELQCIADYPKLAHRGVEITRILRRTNTGPAKAKTTTARKTKKAASEELLKGLMEDI